MEQLIEPIIDFIKTHSNINNEVFLNFIKNQPIKNNEFENYLLDYYFKVLISKYGNILAYLDWEYETIKRAYDLPNYRNSKENKIIL